MTAEPHPFEHEHYEELCALATAGALIAAEAEDLFAHLDQCAECSKHFQEYQSLAGEGLPRLVDLHRTAPEADRFDDESALRRLLQDVNRSDHKKHVPVPPSRQFSRPLWQSVAAATLIIGLALGFYKLGESRHHDAVKAPLPIALQQMNPGQELQVLRASLREAKQRQDALQALVAQRGVDLDRAREDAKEAQAHVESLSASMASAQANSSSELKAVTAERDAAFTRVQAAELSAQNTVDELNALRKQDLERIASLEGRVSGLTVTLNDQNSRAKDDEQYLASDKDIRDLIGARNLYIADIMDVREDGSSRKPFGRVFYTKTKSLIFYAYDLDNQPGVKKASTFHVWGRTGPNDPKPLNLGVLYLDSETNKRWTLRVDNPEQLARLDSVFVTVEQHEQTDKPTGKPFLYASLRREPNHP